jgi:hypothetical protein
MEDNNNQSTENGYKTRSFYLAAFFVSNGHHLDVTDADERNKYFVFADITKEDKDKLITEFYGSEFIQDYISAIKFTKKKLYEDAPPVKFKDN